MFANFHTDQINFEVLASLSVFLTCTIRFERVLYNSPHSPETEWCDSHDEAGWGVMERERELVMAQFQNFNLGSGNNKSFMIVI